MMQNYMLILESKFTKIIEIAVLTRIVDVKSYHEADIGTNRSYDLEAVV